MESCADHRALELHGPPRARVLELHRPGALECKSCTSGFEEGILLKDPGDPRESSPI